MTIPHLIPVLRSLAAGQVLTTAQLAHNLSVDNIKERLAVLRDTFGLVVQEGAHWRLRYHLEWLDKSTLATALGVVAVKDEVSSTNDWARQHDGTFCFAEHQTQGRGRRGRTWLAMPAVSILMSVCLPCPPQLAGLSLAVGTALQRALDNGGRLLLKWPNDLLTVTGKKVGGVLIEMAGEKVIIGVGLNLLMTPQLQVHLNCPATGLTEVMGACSSRHHYAMLVATAVSEAAQQFTRTGLTSFLEDATQAHCIKINAPFSLRINGKNINGIFAGFDHDGAVLMRCNGRLQRFMSGEITGVAGR